MSTKNILRIVLAASIIAVVLLAAQVFSSKSAQETVTNVSASEERLAGSDNIMLHPVVPLPANYYKGSDWIERHPVPTLPANYYTGSDWVERHSQDPFEAAEWAKPDPSQTTR